MKKIKKLFLYLTGLSLAFLFSHSRNIAYALNTAPVYGPQAFQNNNPGQTVISKIFSFILTPLNFFILISSCCFPGWRNNFYKHKKVKKIE